MTRIGMVCFPSVGGSGTLAVELARQLEERGHSVTLIARERPARMRDDASFVRVEPTQHALFESSPYTLALARTLVLEAKRRALDVLHLHYAVPHAASALLVREALGKSRPAIVVTAHGTDVTGFGQDAGHAPILAASLRAADVVTAPSRFLADRANDSLGIAPVVVPNFVDVDAFQPGAPRADAEALSLIHVSSFRPVKAVSALVPVMRALGARARMVLVGDGPERARVEVEAKDAGVAMRFVGALAAPREVADWLRASDLFVLPSESESFGLAALEALACGVPVIARCVGGLPEVVQDGVTGVLVDSPSQLASAILSLSHGARTEMAQRAAIDARRRFAPSIVVGQYEAVYERAMRARRGEDDA